jgi:hypothetical protein
MGQLGMAWVIAGMLLGMLLQVKCKCVYFVFFNVRFFVGFGAAMMGGSFLMHCRGKTSGTLCSAGMSVAICFWGLTANGRGNRWGLLAGRICRS